MTEMIRSVPNGGLEPDFGRYVRRTFPQKLRGYSPADVDAHLRLIQGWFTLAGFEQFLAEHREELLGAAMQEAEATVEQARREAERTIERARREAEATVEQARRESETLLDEATRRAAATNAAAEQRLVSLKTLASAILEEADAQSRPMA
jgi:DivIVA domain-containing protein